MYTLYYLILSPFCRKVTLVLGEKKIEYQKIHEVPWQRRKEFLPLNPAVETPVLQLQNGDTVCDSTVITEYLEEVHTETNLLGNTALERAESRRIAAWFDIRFRQEVSRSIVREKVYRRMRKDGTPSSNLLRAAYSNVHYHMDYIDFLTERRNWLAGDTLTIADLAAGAHISAIDYTGDVPWDKHPIAKEWYTRLKSRPSFRPLLQERVTNMKPVAHYDDLDF